MANWNNPLLTSTYVNFVTEVRARDEDVARQFDPAFVTLSNQPVNTIRWNGGTARWERWNGTAWNVLAATYAISISGSAATLTTARTINGTSFNGSGDIITASWGTARTITIGATGKSVNGSAAVSWTLAEIGAPSLTGAGASGNWGISITGNAATATAWQTGRTLSIGGTGKSVDGSDNVTWTKTEIGVGGASAYEVITANRTLTAADVGKAFLVNASVTITLPNSTTLPDGAAFTFLNSGGTTITVAGSTVVTPTGATQTTFTGESTTLFAVLGSNQYRSFGSGQGISAPGAAPLYACRAWVNFNGTTSPGTIRASGNVSSVTKNGTGDYTINFTTAMPDANYAASVTATVSAALNASLWGRATTFAAGSYRTTIVNQSPSAIDPDFVSVVIFR